MPEETAPLTTNIVAGPGGVMTDEVGVVTGDERYWPTAIPPRPSPPGAALDLLDRSIQDEATVVAIGSYTNLALLEVARPGRLGRVPVVAMGGWTGPPADGLPAWGRRRTTTCSSTPGRRRFWPPPLPSSPW